MIIQSRQRILLLGLITVMSGCAANEICTQTEKLNEKEISHLEKTCVRYDPLGNCLEHRLKTKLRNKSICAQYRCKIGWQTKDGRKANVQAGQCTVRTDNSIR